MRAWFHTPGSTPSGRRPWARAKSSFSLGLSRAKRRERTLRTFPSTAATRSPKAMEATAAAV